MNFIFKKISDLCESFNLNYYYILMIICNTTCALPTVYIFN